jgi:hypothetical protein
MNKVLNPVEVYAPERSKKIELNEKIHFDTMKLLYAQTDRQIALLKTQ